LSEDNLPVAPGKTLLKTAGIFYAVAGAFSFISGVTFIVPAVVAIPDDVLRMTIDDFFMISDYLAIGGLLAVRNLLGVPVRFMFLFIVVTSIIILFMGLTAIKHCDYLKKAKRLMRFAAINLSIMLAHMILNLSFGSVLGTVIAVIFLAGAYKNNQEYKKGL
jgi:hypothetical protein